MTSTDEQPAPVLTLKERIAALQLAQAADNNKLAGPAAPSPSRLPFRKAATEPPPPPLPRRPSEGAPASTRPVQQPASRGRAARAADNQRGQEAHPPPMPRRPSQPQAAAQPPTLPPRRPSEPTHNRRLSTESFSSTVSARSSVSALSARTATTNASSQRAAPSVVSDAAAARATFPAPISSPGSKARSLPPKAAIRSNISAPAKARIIREEDETPPPMPARPPAAPQALVPELDFASFDDVVLRSGKPCFVDFYAPFCKYCKELDPEYELLADKYKGHNISIVKIDSYTHKPIGERYQVEGWPTLKFFDGRGSEPVNFQWMRNVEMMSRFIDEQMAVLPPPSVGSTRPPPIPVASRPTF